MDDGPDWTVLPAPLEPHASEGRKAEGDAGREAELVSPPTPSGAEAIRAFAHGESQGGSTPGGIVAGQRIVEENHQPVRLECCDRRLKPLNQLTDALVPLAEDPHGLLRLGPLRQLGEPAQVGAD